MERSIGNELRTMAVIPARGGSKELPGKNLRLLAGKPLLAYSIEQARASGVCDVVLVSTDDKTIAQVAREHGAEVPFLRPAELAGDATPAEPVVRHALETYEAMTRTPIDIIVYLQPTDLFRTPALIRECVLRLKAAPTLDSVFAAYKTHKNFWRRGPEGGGYVRLAADLATYQCRQFRKDLIYREDAGLASATRATVVRSGRRLGERVDIVVTDDFRTSIDIHSEFDFWLAEKILTEWNPIHDPGWGSQRVEPLVDK